MSTQFLGVFCAVFQAYTLRRSNGAESSRELPRTTKGVCAAAAWMVHTLEPIFYPASAFEERRTQLRTSPAR